MKQEEQIEVTAVAKQPLKLQNVEQGLCAKEVSSKQSLLVVKKTTCRPAAAQTQAGEAKETASRTLSKYQSLQGPREHGYQRHVDAITKSQREGNSPDSLVSQPRERETKQH